jgi:hypothetical protein
MPAAWSMPLRDSTTVSVSAALSADGAGDGTGAAGRGCVVPYSWGSKGVEGAAVGRAVEARAARVVIPRGPHGPRGARLRGERPRADGLDGHHRVAHRALAYDALVDHRVKQVVVVVVGLRDRVLPARRDGGDAQGPRVEHVGRRRQRGARPPSAARRSQTGPGASPRARPRAGRTPESPGGFPPARRRSARAWPRPRRPARSRRAPLEHGLERAQGLRVGVARVAVAREGAGDDRVEARRARRGGTPRERRDSASTMFLYVCASLAPLKSRRPVTSPTARRPSTTGRPGGRWGRGRTAPAPCTRACP